uniref:Syringolide-induced protein 14-1-1 n=1 Tax=Phaseolus vulgaris TaxID=3885 RepID=T2DNU1_PHAVU|nr:syringolide-induced protein 14-1-1 [Phaseolus vulgaris]
MEKENKQSKLKNKILKILPKAAAAVTFQNPPFSPGRDHKFKTHGGKGFFSGPMIPDEARRKPRHGGVETQEPTSPKISCMGQIKHKKKHIQKGGAKSTSTSTRARESASSATPGDTTEEKKQGSKFQRLLFHAGKPKAAARKKSDAGEDRAPPLGHMRRFASGRETFSNFEWKAQIAPGGKKLLLGQWMIEWKAMPKDEVDNSFLCPLKAGRCTVAYVQPRKEINLWKRRTMAAPRPLQLNPVLTAK